MPMNAETDYPLFDGMWCRRFKYPGFDAVQSIQQIVVSGGLKVKDGSTCMHGTSKGMLSFSRAPFW